MDVFQGGSVVITPPGGAGGSGSKCITGGSGALMGGGVFNVKFTDVELSGLHGTPTQRDAWSHVNI